MPYLTPQQQMPSIWGGSPQPGGIWGPVSGFLGNHSNALMQGGLSLLAGNDLQDAARYGMQAIPQGVAMDRQNADRKRDEADRKKLSDALAKIASDPNSPLRGPYADLAMADSDFGKSAVLQSMKPPDLPTSYQESQLAAKDPRYANFLTQRQTASATRNMAAPPPGYRVIYDENNNPVRMEPIEGGPAANANERQSESAQRSGGIVTEDIDRALTAIEAHPNLTTGVGAQVTGRVAGTPASNVSALLDSVRSNISFDRLQAMRQASPTGGALGSVSDNDMKLLQSTLGSLQQSQGSEQLLYNLKRLKNLELDIIHGEGNGPPREDLGQGIPAAGAAPMPAPPPGAVQDGYRFKGGDPADQKNWESVN